MDAEVEDAIRSDVLGMVKLNRESQRFGELCDILLSWTEEISTVSSELRCLLCEVLLEGLQGYLSRILDKKAVCEDNVLGVWQHANCLLELFWQCHGCKQMITAFWNKCWFSLRGDDANEAVGCRFSQLGCLITHTLKSLVFWGNAIGIPFLELCSFQEACNLRFSLQLAQPSSPGGAADCADLLQELDSQLCVTAEDAGPWELLPPAFEEVLKVLQVPELRRRDDEENGSTGTTAARSAYEFLLRWRHADSAASAEAWAACTAAALDSLLAEAQARGRAAAERSPNFRAVAAALTQPEEAGLVLRLLTALPRCADKKGMKLAFDLYGSWYEEHPMALLAACAALLQPDCNCPLDVRLASLAAMRAAALSYLNDLEDGESGDAARLNLWPSEAVQALLFALARDPAVRVRRAAMGLVATIAVPRGGPRERMLLRAVCEKCRDVDGPVREQAWALLLQFPMQTVLNMLQADDWRTLFDTGFAASLLAAPTGKKSRDPAASPSTAVEEHCSELLLSYLTEPPEGATRPEAVQNALLERARALQLDSLALLTGQQRQASSLSAALEGEGVRDGRDSLAVMMLRGYAAVAARAAEQRECLAAFAAECAKWGGSAN